MDHAAHGNAPRWYVARDRSDALWRLAWPLHCAAHWPSPLRALTGPSTSSLRTVNQPHAALEPALVFRRESKRPLGSDGEHTVAALAQCGARRIAGQR